MFSGDLNDSPVPIGRKIKCDNDVVPGPCFENKFGCQNGGTCMMDGCTRTCQCQDGYEGDICQTRCTYGPHQITMISLKEIHVEYYLIQLLYIGNLATLRFNEYTKPTEISLL